MNNEINMKGNIAVLSIGIFTGFVYPIGLFVYCGIITIGV